MVLNFLQTRDPPVLPALQQMAHDEYYANDGSESGFADDLDQIKRMFEQRNTETLPQLFFHFFRTYGHVINYGTQVVSVKAGRLLSREEKNWHILKEAGNPLCVEEPFNTTRNLGNTADATAFRGIHLEIRQAFDALADGGQLDRCCEQFEFPPEEKITFKKPTPAPKPVLSYLPTQSNRGGRGGFIGRGRGGNMGQKQNQNQSYRRSSSSSVYGGQRPPPPYNYPVSNALPDVGSTLHEKLYNEYRILSQKTDTLKAHLAQTQGQLSAGAQALQHQAIIQAQAQAQLRGQLLGQLMPNQRMPVANGHPIALSAENAPSNGAYFSGHPYPYPMHFEPSSPASYAAPDGSRTNPSSPSLSQSIPMSRRGTQRSSVENGHQSSSVRSQSQPARVQVNPALLQPYQQAMQGYDASSIVGMLPSQYSQDFQAQRGLEIPFRLARGLPMEVSATHNSPKEYVGYYVGESPQIPPQYPASNNLPCSLP